MILVFWHRIGLGSVLLRSVLFGALWLLTGIPTLLGFLGTRNVPRIQYPPYLPTLMTAFGEIMKPDAVLATDMPWAMAWYGDRRQTVKIGPSKSCKVVGRLLIRAEPNRHGADNRYCRSNSAAAGVIFFCAESVAASDLPGNLRLPNPN
jgi:hypothetical protein